MMDLVEIHVVRAEPAQRVVDGVEDVLARGATIPGAGPRPPRALGGEHEVAAAAAQPAPQDLLGAAHRLGGAAQRIDVGGVEEADAARRRAIENREGSGLVALQPERHGAETETRDGKAGTAELDVAHGPRE